MPYKTEVEMNAAGYTALTYADQDNPMCFECCFHTGTHPDDGFNCRSTPCSPALMGEHVIWVYRETA